MRLQNILHIIKHTHSRNARGWINILAIGLIIQAHISANNWRIEGFTRLFDSLARFFKLPHYLRILWASEVQAIRNRKGASAAQGNVAPHLCHCLFCALFGIEIAKPTLASDTHSQALAIFFDTNDTRTPRATRDYCVSLHARIVLRINPRFITDFRRI